MLGAFLYNIEKGEILFVEGFLLTGFCELKLEAVPVKSHQWEWHEVVSDESCILP